MIAVAVLLTHILRNADAMIKPIITEDGFNMVTDTDEDKIILEYVVASNAYNENLDSLYINIERP